MTPHKQIKLFLGWFQTIGVPFFDIHLRKPKSPHEDYHKGNWQWLRQNEHVTAAYIQQALLPWLRYENAHGSDIYFRPHGNSNNAVVFLDDVSLDNALKVAKKYTACIVETSPHNTQIWLGINKPCDTFTRKVIQVSLKNKGFSDPGSISGDHLGRLCGMKSQKHNTWVNLVTTSQVQPYVHENDTNTAKSISPPYMNRINGDYTIDCIKKTNFDTNRGACASLNQSSVDSSQSGKEFGWVLGMLRAGYCVDTVGEKLYSMASRRNKKFPKLYGNRTIEKAKNVLNE